MAGEEQYINPIIQAMTQNVAAQQNQERIKQQVDAQKQLAMQHDAEKKLRERQLANEEDRLQYEKEHGMGILAMHQKMTEAQIEGLAIDHLLKKRQASLQNIDLESALGKGGGLGIPSPVQAQQQEAQNIRSRAQAQSEGASQGALSAQKDLLAQQGSQAIELANNNHKSAMDIAVQHGADALKAAKVHGEYGNANANIAGAYHLKGIAMLNSIGEQENAEKAKQLTDGIYNGTMDLKSLPQSDKKLVEAYSTGTGELNSLPSDNKAYVKKLDAISGLQTIVDQYRSLANSFSRDSPGAFKSGNQNVTLPLLGTLQRTEPGSDLESNLNSMKASGGQLATYFDQQNRKSDAEILRQVTGSFDPKSTKNQNLEKLNKHITQLQQAVKNTFTGMKPDRINKILGDRNITDFGAFGGKTEKTYKINKVNPTNNHTIGSDDGKNWFDAQTGEQLQVQ